MANVSTAQTSSIHGFTYNGFEYIDLGPTPQYPYGDYAKKDLFNNEVSIISRSEFLTSYEQFSIQSSVASNTTTCRSNDRYSDNINNLKSRLIFLENQNIINQDTIRNLIVRITELETRKQRAKIIKQNSRERVAK